MAWRCSRGWILTVALLPALALSGAPALGDEGSADDPLAPEPHPQPPPAPQPPPEPHVVVGMSENTVAAFHDPRFLETGIGHARLIVPYDVVWAGGRRLADTDAWLDTASALGVEPLVSFAFSGRRGRRWHLPTPREYGARVREFRERYPWVREYTTWNEANHKHMQPTGRRPVRTAGLYRELRRQCLEAGCTAVAVDVMLTGARRTWRWIRSFRRRAGPGPHIWGAHNYPDANRRSSVQTRRFLRTVSGDVWVTETGGIVRFARRWRRNERRAARSLRHAFHLASISPRLRRLYIYNWQAVRRNRRWDSGLMSAAGRPRPAYFALLEALSGDLFRPRPPAEVQSDPPKPLPTLAPDSA